MVFHSCSSDSLKWLLLCTSVLAQISQSSAFQPTSRLIPRGDLLFPKSSFDARHICRSFCETSWKPPTHQQRRLLRRRTNRHVTLMSAAAEESQNAVKEFERWIEDNGVTTDGLRLGEVNGIRGVIATRGIASGEVSPCEGCVEGGGDGDRLGGGQVILRVPLRICLHDPSPPPSLLASFLADKMEGWNAL